MEDYSTLGLALIEKKFKEAEIILQYKNDLERGYGRYGSAMNLACSNLKANIVHILLDSGANPNSVDKKNNTP